MTTGHRSKNLLNENLRPQERDIATVDQKFLAFMAEGVNPAKITFATYPQTGTFEAIPSGRTIFDLRNMRVVSADRDTAINAMLRFEEIRSFIIAVDSVVAVEARPTNQKFVLPPGVIEIASRDIEEVIFQSDLPFAMQLAWGTAINGIDVWVPSVNLQRYSSTALSKTNGAGIADTFANLLFVPRHFNDFTGVRTLTPQATYGNAVFSVLGYANKGILVRNTHASVDLDVLVRGAIMGDEGANRGYVNDPDTGVGGEAPVTIPANTAKMLRSSTPFALMQVAARVSAAEAASAAPTVIVEVYAQLPGGGEG